MGLDRVKQQICEKLGFEAHKGTLNLKFNDEASQAIRSFTKPRPGISIEPVDSTFA